MTGTGNAQGEGLQGRRILVVTFVRFWAERAGREQRIRALLRALQQAGGEIHVVFAGALGEQERQAALEAGASSIVGSGAAWAWPWRRRAPRLNLRLADYRDRRVLRAVRRRCLAVRPQVLLVEYLRMAYVLEALPYEMVKVIDTLDVLHQHVDSFRERGLDHGYSITAEEEAAALKAFDLILAIQDQDAGVFRRLCPQRTVITVRPSFEDGAIASSGAPGLSAGQVLFVGSHAMPNVLAVQEFIRHAWPRILAGRPDAELVVCGGVCRLLQADAPRVRKRGFVSELGPAYADADVVISPVTVGGGMKIKCIDALARGKACVVTAHTAVGLEDGADRAFRVADSWDRFADLVLELLNSREKRLALGQEAAGFVRGHLRHAAAVAPLIRALSAPRG